MARQTIRLYGHGKSSLCQRLYEACVVDCTPRSLDSIEDPDEPEYDVDLDDLKLRLVHAYGRLAGDASVHVLIAGNADEALRSLQKCRPAAGKIVVLSNKMHGVEDPLVPDLARQHGHPCAVADLKTGQGVPECWALIKTFL